MKRLGLLLALLLVVAACSDDEAATTTAPALATTSSTTTTTQPPTTTTEPATTTTTIDPAVLAAEEFEADKRKIRLLWTDYSDSWFQGRDNAVTFIVKRNHPAMGYTFEDFACTYTGIGEGYHEEVIVNTLSIIRTDEWVLPGLAGSVGEPSPIDGTIPSGRLYAVQVEFTTTEPGFDPTLQAMEIHVAIVANVAYAFHSPLSC